jgi:hypothetical protein
MPKIRSLSKLDLSPEMPRLHLDAVDVQVGNVDVPQFGPFGGKLRNGTAVMEFVAAPVRQTVVARRWRRDRRAGRSAGWGPESAYRNGPSSKTMAAKRCRAINSRFRRPYSRCSSSTSALSEKYPGFEVSVPRGGGCFGNVFQPRSGQTISLLNANTPACAGPLISKIQFNGVGGLPTHIRLNPNGDVFA